MSLGDELGPGVDQILDQPWVEREGIVVPETDDVALKGGAVEVHVAILYTDLADSTRLVSEFDPRTGAKVMKSFLYCASRIIRHRDGAIRSFDGDRVMGIFIGDSKNSNSAQAALNINWAMKEVIRPKVEAKYPTLLRNGFELRHASGIDRSKVLAVRAGMRGSNDLIWIGRAAAVAAKLSSIRTGPASFITKDVYDNLNADAKLSNGQDMWKLEATKRHGLTVYSSTWRWKP